MKDEVPKPIPKRQHFIPILHLKHFVGREPEGQVWTYDAETGDAWSATPENTAVQAHFYSAERADGTMDTTIEETFAKIEGAAAPVYEQLLSGEIPKDSQARVDFAVFVALMYARTPAMRRMAAEMYGRGLQIMTYAYAENDRVFESLMKRFEKDRDSPITDAMKERLRQDMLDPSGYIMEVSKESTFSALGVADKLTPLFFKMRWSLGAAREGYFITSDNPVARMVARKNYHPIYGDGGFLNKTAEVTFPLSPKCLLMMTWHEDAPDLGTFDRDPVRQFNRIRAAHSDRYLYAHLGDARLARLAAKFKDLRPSMTIEGFGPEKFATVKIPRRFKPK